MSDEPTTDEQSHYEISLTAGQAFVAFVLLLLSLAASFAFGLMIGRGQGDERLVVRKEQSVVTEAAAIPKKSGKIVELGVADEGFKSDTAATDTTSTDAAVLTEGTATSTDTASTAAPSQPDPSPAGDDTAKPAITTNPPPAAAKPAPPQQKAPDGHASPVYAQLLSTSDQKTAETLAAKVINGGFTSAYVDRMTTDKGPVFRVRVRFPSEAEARGSEAKLREFAKDVWIVK